MRRLLWVSALVVACKGGKDDAASAKAVQAALTVPKVDVASVLATNVAQPPVLLVIGETDVRIAAARSWADLDAGKMVIARRPGPLDQVDRWARSYLAMGKQPIDAVVMWNKSSAADIELALLADTSEEDPPPPEEPEEDDTPRVEGQWTFPRNQEDPQLARQRAIEEARRSGGLFGGAASTLDESKMNLPPELEQPLRPNEDGTPSRVAQVQGTIRSDGKLEPLRTMILIAPAARATKLVETLRATSGAIAVSQGGKVRPLRLQLVAHRDYEYGFAARRWVEVRISARQLVVEAVPDKPIDVADTKGLAAAIDTARTTRGTKPDVPVDILVDAEVDVQRLIDVVVALDAAGVKVIGMGAQPSADELARRGHRIPTVWFGQPAVMGDLDKAVLRRIAKEAKPDVLACYTKALATHPDLSGTVSAEFLIKADGKIASLAANGVDPAVASCVSDILRKLEFPKSAGGASTHVMYSFTLRP